MNHSKIKTLIVIRHAKAERFREPDRQRVLTERGRRDAALMAEKLLKKGYSLDMILSSPAARTTETAGIFADVQGMAVSNIKYFDDLYLGGTPQITEAIIRLGEDARTLAVCGHNLGVSNFVNDATGSHIEHLPTTGIAFIKVHCNNWQQWSSAEKILVETDGPSNKK